MCVTPFIKNDKKNGVVLTLPCGKCPVCASKRTSAWSFRLMQEERSCSSAFFLTLTYGPLSIAVTKNGFLGLSKRDLQLFFKRLRKAHEPDAPKIKYFAVGEYGSKTFRPHYHIILFNARLELIQPAWNLGQIHYGEVNGASVGYTLKYLSKPGRIPMFKNDDRLPEFALMSLGLGLDYLSDSMMQWHYNDLTNRMYCPLPDGKKITMPRYYKDRLYSEHQRYAIKLVAERRRAENAIKNPPASDEAIINMFKWRELSHNQKQKL